MINEPSDSQEPKEERNGSPSPKRRIFHFRPPSKIVKRISEPLWMRRGWQRKGDDYRGFYRTQYGSYQGKIVYRYAGKVQFFIINPPACLKDHPHAPCFISKGGGKFEVHFEEKSKTIDDGILAIEQILIDAHERSTPHLD